MSSSDILVCGMAGHEGVPMDTEPAAAVKAPAPTRSMVDSAYPLKKPPATDIVLIYAGGDTVHPWTTAEILAMPARYRWPCWVRSNPQAADGGTEAALFAAWLHGHHVPQNTCVVLDLETAVNAVYVNAFNLHMRAAGWRVTKYGSQDYIWKNPKTDGGTFVALEGPAVLTTEGDTVARQYAFDGTFDLSVAKPQHELTLWDARPPAKAGPFRHVLRGTTLAEYARRRDTTVEHLAQMIALHYTAGDVEVAGDIVLNGLPVYTLNP
jgi:hypothetical protein